MNFKKRIAYIIFAVTIISGCEDLMTKKLDIDVADYPPQLAVTAILDTDSGRFSICMSAGYSMNHYKEWRPVYDTISGNGTIHLYMDDEPDPVLAVSGLFQLSGMKTIEHIYRYDTTYYNTYSSSYDTSFVNIPAKAGSTYRLEVEVDGFPKVTSTAVMPDDPIVGEVKVDTSITVIKNYPAFVQGWGGFNQFWPISLRLTDNPPSPDYYSFGIHTHIYSNDGWVDYRQPDYDIGTTNIVLIQDNPDVESAGIFTELGGNDIYMFDRMLISDASFANTTITLPLYMTQYYNYDGSDKRPDYDPDIHGREVRMTEIIYFEVKHLSKETFMHYRSLVQQRAGGGILSEPVFIKSNIENGWGSFSLSNTKRIKILECVYYRYPEWYYSPSIEP